LVVSPGGSLEASCVVALKVWSGVSWVASSGAWGLVSFIGVGGLVGGLVSGLARSSLVGGFVGGRVGGLV
jgi:hypothetical protein